MNNPDTLTEHERHLWQSWADGGTIVVNMSKAGQPRLWAWAQANNRAVRIDRRSRWGNPYPITAVRDRAEALREYSRRLPLKPELLADLPQLRGMILGCWCHPRHCHGDYLAALATDRRCPWCGTPLTPEPRHGNNCPLIKEPSPQLW
jgi:Domain of unknown function (DUF4326)